MYVCMYVCMHVRMNECKYVLCMHVCTDACVSRQYVLTYIPVYLFMYVYMYLFTNCFNYPSYVSSLWNRPSFHSHNDTEWGVQVDIFSCLDSPCGPRRPLYEWSVRRRHLYLTTHNTHNRQTSMSMAGFEPAIPAREWPQIYALHRTATGIG